MPTVTRLPPEPIPPRRVQIILTEDEALDLRKVLSQAKGKGGERTAILRSALDSAGITYDAAVGRWS